MPSFAGVIQGKEEAITTYLLSGDDRAKVNQESDLLEIRHNRLALADTKNTATDTTATYLNVLAYAPFKGAGNYPAIKPPWGTLNAINLSTGEYVWRIPVGNDTLLPQKNGQPTGLTGSPGPIVTAGGLVFIAGGKDRKLSAFDKESGKLLWETELPGLGSSTPCTYMREGKQYIALSVAGDKKDPAGTIIAFALP
jgi:quinoprotein glucose dehydrogenase